MRRSQAVLLGTVLVILMLAGVYVYSLSGVSRFENIKGSKAEPEESVSLVFVGDIMLDRGVRNAINREGMDYILGEMRGILTEPDLTVGNLEGTFTTEPTVSMDGSKLKFTFDPTLSRSLREYGFDGFSLANNHALDFGLKGFVSTQSFLAEQDMFSFGSPLNDTDLSAQVSVREEQVCFVGYHSLYNSSINSVVAEISSLESRECTYTVVFAHWGEEYKLLENEAQRSAGRAFVDAGADLVIGHHPHVVQPVEVYKDKAIFYSLGNFVFDQDFSLTTRQGLVVRLELRETEQRFELIPTEMSRAHLYLPDTEPISKATSTNSFVLPR